jgi:hypothetical protein
VNLDSAGHLSLSNAPPTDAERRFLAVVGWLNHPSRTHIEDAVLEPYAGTDVYSQLGDFLLSFGSFNVEGNVYGPLSGLTIQRSAGTSFEVGSGYSTIRRDPNVLPTGAESPAVLRYYYRDGLGDWVNNLATRTTIDPEHWDDGSIVLATVPDETPWTIQPLMFYPLLSANDLQYGQAVYASYAEARSALQVSIAINPYNSYDTFRGWLIVRKGATDLTDTSHGVFVGAGKLGLVDVASGGGLGGEINTASNAGLVGVGLYDQKLGVDLQFKNLAAGSSKVTIADDPDPDHHAVLLDVADENLTIAQSQVTGLATTLSGKVDTGDTRLSDARSPTAHALSHATGYGDAISIAESQVDGLATSLSGKAPTADGVSQCTQDDLADGTTYKRFSATEQTKLGGIEAGAEVNVNADWNAVAGDAFISNKPTLGTAAAAATTDFAPAANGVTSGDGHDHTSGHGAQIAYSSLGSPPTLGTAAAKNIPAAGDAAVTEVVYGTDTRLTNARAPSAHAAGHTNGTDQIANASQTTAGLMSSADKTKLDNATGIDAAFVIAMAAALGG